MKCGALWLSWIAAFAVVLLMDAPHASTQGGVSPPNARPPCEGTRLRDIKPCIQTFVDDGTILGLVTLIDRRGLPVQVDFVGEYRPDSIFQIASVSKSFIAVGIMILIEQGKIPSVDSKVSALAGFGDFPYRDTTIKQLLTHTSGMWFKHQDASLGWMGVEPFLTNRMDKMPGITVREKPLAVVARHYANASLYPLGAQDYHYSNIGYLMLGWVIERLSGRPLDRFMEAEVFDKLGLKDTFYLAEGASPDQRARIARLDRRNADPPDYSHYDERRPGWAYVSPGGGLYSTAADLQAFLNLFRHRGQVPGRTRVLRPDTVDMMTTDAMPTLDFGCNGQLGRGLGFAVVRAPGCPGAPAYSAGTVFHRGRFSTEFWYDSRKDEIGVSLYQRVEDEDSGFPPRRVLQRLVSRITGS